MAECVSLSLRCSISIRWLRMSCIRRNSPSATVYERCVCVGGGGGYMCACEKDAKRDKCLEKCTQGRAVSSEQHLG